MRNDDEIESGTDSVEHRGDLNEDTSPLPQRPKKVTFDDFQIQKNVHQRQIDDEKIALEERHRRIEEQKPGFLKFAVPRLRSIGEEMIGGTKKLSSIFFGRQEEEHEALQQAQSHADEEQLHIRVVKTTAERRTTERRDQPTVASRKKQHEAGPQQLKPKTPDLFQPQAERDVQSEVDATPLDLAQTIEEQYQSELANELMEDELVNLSGSDEGGISDDILAAADTLDAIAEDEFDSREEDEAEVLAAYASEEENEESENSEFVDEDTTNERADEQVTRILDEPRIESALEVYLDALRDFDVLPRRASEPRDPRADFVQLLSAQLDILREQVSAMSALFFWVNAKKQQLVLESGALEDRAHMFLSEEKRFPIELDAVSTAVTRKKPELHSSIPPLAELDLIPYYTDQIGVRSFAAMPVLFGEGIVGVITVDSSEDDQFSQETLRILTEHSKLLSGLIRSYIEKYDLLAAARTLESARKLYQIVSPDASIRAMRDQRKSTEWVLRALTEAMSEIIDWEWLATASFDETRRIWSITSLQSKHTKPYLQPGTQIDLAESIVGKCLQSGRSSRFDHLTGQQLRFSFEEDRAASVGHSFLTIPIRTSSKNYGALAIEHSERTRYTDADVDTLEHLARSAAAALEITALSEIVEERALTDLLTGVLNKRGFLQRINEELSRAMEFDDPLTLVLFEIDSAAEFFSRFAQEDADTIVLAVTRLLRYGARPFDVVARVGEHAFAAILIKMPDEEGYLWSEKMRKMIVSEVIAIGKRSFSVTVSAGVSGARRDATIEELIEGAELAVERAKELGGNNVIVY